MFKSKKKPKSADMTPCARLSVSKSLTKSIAGILLFLCIGQISSAQSVFSISDEDARCERFLAWYSIIEDMNGSNAFQTWSTFNKPIMMNAAVAFADDVFPDYFGKRYAELRNRDRSAISRLVDNCHGGKFGNRYFPLSLKQPFGYRRGERRNADQWAEIIRAQPRGSALVEAARSQSSQASASYDQRNPILPRITYSQVLEMPASTNRPARGTSNICVEGPGEWRFRMNEVFYEQFTGAISRNSNDNRGGNTACNWRYGRKYVVDEFKALVQQRSQIAFVRGDVCVEEPILAIVVPDELEIRAHENTSVEITSSTRNLPLADLYSAFDGGALNFGSGITMTNTISRFVELAYQQCGSIPKQVRLVGINNIPTVQKPSQFVRNPRNEFSFSVGYKGTLIVDGQNTRIEHDDVQEAAYYRSRLVARRDYFNEKDRFREEQFKAGVSLFTLGMLGLYSSSPCNDPNLSREEWDILCGGG